MQLQILLSLVGSPVFLNLRNSTARILGCATCIAWQFHIIGAMRVNLLHLLVAAGAVVIEQHQLAACLPALIMPRQAGRLLDGHLPLQRIDCGHANVAHCLVAVCIHACHQHVSMATFLVQHCLCTCQPDQMTIGCMTDDSGHPWLSHQLGCSSSRCVVRQQRAENQRAGWHVAT